MDKLTLPRPATDLWTPARDIIHEIPTPEEAPHPIRPHIAGGSALAARWNHRASTDIDIVFPGRESLTDLIENDPLNILQRLGGTPDVVDHRQIVIDFPNGAIDLAAIDPKPELGQADTLVDGRLETVLSNAQILRGKLERAHDLNARDIFDVAVAAREDPAALATALNMLPDHRTSAVMWHWHQGDPEIRDRYAADELLWTSPDHRIEPHELADQAVHALHTHRYRRLQVDVDGPDIIITKTIRTGTLPAETYNRSDPAAALTESGLAAHLAVAGPVRPAQLASAIEKSIASMNILDTTGRGLTLPTDHQPDPTSINQRDQNRTRSRE